MSTPKDIQSKLGKDKHPVEVFAYTGPEADRSSHPRANPRPLLKSPNITLDEPGHTRKYEP